MNCLRTDFAFFGSYIIADGGFGIDGFGGAKIIRHVGGRRKNAKFIKAHAGQKFCLRDAEKDAKGLSRK